jgi:protein-tyrosine phosphatase
MTAAAETHGVRARRLPLQGVVNFRDLGGYVMTDGRAVKWGQIFRSDALSELTDADLVVLGDLGLRTVCDLRAESERAHMPNRKLPGLEPAVHRIGFMPFRGAELLADARAGVIATTEIESWVREIYRRFVMDQTENFARLLAVLETATLPMLIHCTSGRDRTGFASAVILMALGATRLTISEDYLLSNRYRRDLTRHIGAPVDSEVMTTLTNAHPEYLAAAFKAIDDCWGSDAAYLREALGLSANRQSRLRERLLERPQ